MKNENPFKQYLAKLDAQELSDIVLNYVDDKDAVRNFLDSTLDEEIKEQLIEVFNEGGFPIVFIQRGYDDDGLTTQDLSNQIDEDPENAELYYLRAKVYHTMGNLDNSFSDLRKAVLLNEKYADAYGLFVDLLLEAGNITEALTVANQLIANVRDSDAYNLRGVIFLSAGKYKEAHIDFTSAIKLNPRDKIYYSNRGSSILMMNGDPKEALADYLECRNLAPEFDLESIASCITEAENRIKGNDPIQPLFNPKIQTTTPDENKTKI